MLTDINLLDYILRALASWKETRRNIKAIKQWKISGEIPSKFNTPTIRLTHLLITECIMRKAKGLEIYLSEMKPSIRFIETEKSENTNHCANEIQNLEMIKDIARNILFLSGNFEPTTKEYEIGSMQRKVFFPCGPYKVNGLIEYNFETFETLLESARKIVDQNQKEDENNIKETSRTKVSLTITSVNSKC